MVLKSMCAYLDECHTETPNVISFGTLIFINSLLACEPESIVILFRRSNRCIVSAQNCLLRLSIKIPAKVLHSDRFFDTLGSGALIARDRRVLTWRRRVGWIPRPRKTQGKIFWHLKWSYSVNINFWLVTIPLYGTTWHWIYKPLWFSGNCVSSDHMIALWVSALWFNPCSWQ